MHISRLLSACLLLTTTVLFAESKNPADYPLRVHIFGHNQTTFYHNRYEEESKGEGRANLFENGDVHGIDFNFDCSEKLKSSFGYETYPAKWKKQQRELTVLLPVFGKSNAYFTCTLNAEQKDFAYAAGRNGLRSESPEEFKAWMVKHDYDPEHGKNVPTKLEPVSTKPDQATAAPTAPARQ